jgi:hypothetical protein
MADTKLPEGTDSIIEGAGTGGSTGGTGRSGTTNPGGSTSSATNSTGARTSTTDSASGTDALITGGGSIGAGSSGPSGSSGTGAGGTGTTDIASGSGSTDATGESGDATKSGVRGMISTAGTKARDEAASRARGLVGQGLERGSSTLTNVAGLIEDTVQQIEEKLGPQYGEYARTASQTINGYATSLQNKDPDELVDDARELIRKSPGVALAGAAVVGFGLVRLFKAGIEESQNGTGNRKGNRAS